MMLKKFNRDDLGYIRNYESGIRNCEAQLSNWTAEAAKLKRVVEWRKNRIKELKEEMK